jgi:aldose 1-epimerase
MESQAPLDQVVELSDSDTCKLIKSVTIGLFGANIHKCIATNGISERNIILAYDSPGEYVPPLRPKSHPYHGSTVGRVAGRIKDGRFTLNNIEYQLAVNNGPNALHGGIIGLSERMWTLESKKDNEVVLSIIAEDMEEGYPCKIKAQCTYRLQNDSISVIHEAWHLDPNDQRSTIVNLTNHAYFNLTGGKERQILDHKWQLFTDTYLPLDETNIRRGPCSNYLDGFPKEKQDLGFDPISAAEWDLKPRVIRSENPDGSL